MSESIYERVGARPVINGMGVYTKLGGSPISPTVWAAMTESNDWAVEMGALLDDSGRHLAKLLGVEAARVVPGVAAGLALSVAACMTRGDGPAIERLPDATGLKDGVVVQPRQRYKYLRAAWLSGARPVWAGTDDGTTREQLDAALDRESVAAALFPAHLDATPGTVPLAEFAAAARAHGVPVVIDAAFMSYPPSITARYAAHGDLVGISAKYFYGPNGGGFVYGGQEWIDHVAALDFTRFETSDWKTFGRAFKLDRHTVVGTIVALEEWFTMDHEERLGGYRRMVRMMEEALRGLPGIVTRPRCFTNFETEEDEPVNALVLEIDPRAARRTAAGLHAALYEGDPRIVCHLDGDRIIIAVDAMAAGKDAAVAERLRELLS